MPKIIAAKNWAERTVKSAFMHKEQGESEFNVKSKTNCCFANINIIELSKAKRLKKIIGEDSRAKKE